MIDIPCRDEVWSRPPTHLRRERLRLIGVSDAHKLGDGRLGAHYHSIRSKGEGAAVEKIDECRLACERGEQVRSQL